MAPDVATIEPVLDAPLSVEPSAIEAQFNRIWRETSSTGFDESSIRLRVVNFVAIAAGDGSAERFEQVMQLLPRRHPCRGILVTLDPARHGVEASIAANCWRAVSGTRHLCSEEVLLRGGAADEQALASSALALLVPELPVAVWAIGEVDLESRLAASLVESADRVFVDSAGRDAAASMRALLHAHAEHDVRVSDLAWCRLGMWRGLVAQFFDGDDGQRRLQGLSAINITCGGASLSSEALLLAGWMMSVLDLGLADVSRSENGLRATLYDGSRPVTISLTSGDNRGRALASILMTIPDATLLIELHPDSGHVHVREEWRSGPAHRVVAPDPIDDAALFAEALDDNSGPLLFIAAVRATLSLLREDH